MAKRSKQRQSRQNRDQAGCMWGLISIFDFRHGRTTRRLLSDRRHMAKNNVGLAYSTSEVNLLTDAEERHISIENGGVSEKPKSDVVKTSVKELMEEEMCSEQVSKNQIDGDEVELSEIEHVKNHKHMDKTSKKSFDNHETTSHQVSSQKASEYRNLEALTKELLLIYQKRNGWHGDLDIGANRSFSILDEKLNAVVEAFMNEKSTGIEEKTHHSKDFVDAIQMLSSNKELFLKLLQDQNSLNEDQKLMSKSKLKLVERSNSMENARSNPRSEEPVTRKNRNFFRRRSKSQECVSLKGDESPLTSSRIVILKPGSPDYRPRENEVQSEKTGSQFSFVEIKKRLKQAMGKEQHGEKSTVEGGSGWSSPNRDHFYTERFAKISNGLKRGERISKLRESETRPRENEESGDTSRRISEIYFEAKKHLSEMLSNEDEDAKLMMGSLPNTLGKILSFPEYNTLSHVGSPTKDGAVTSQTRPSPCKDVHVVNESQPCVNKDIFEEKVEVSNEVSRDNLEGDSPSEGEITNFQGVPEIIKSTSPDADCEEQNKIFDVSCEPCGSLNSTDEVQCHKTVEVVDEERYPPCLKVDLREENELSSPTSSPLGSSSANKAEEVESTSSDRTSRPSPISVLEPLFSDNDISPASTVSRPIESVIQPLCIHFEDTVSPSEDQETCIRSCLESEESAFEYVEALLLASDLNWGEFEKRWLCSLPILDSSLFDEVEIFSSQPSHDQRLLFDATNEILEEVCNNYLGFSVESSQTKRNIKPVPKGMDLIIEIWEGIESNLHTLYPRSLDQLVKKDLGVSRTWMDLCFDTQEIVFEVDELIFKDMMDDTLLSFVQDEENSVCVVLDD